MTAVDPYAQAVAFVAICLYAIHIVEHRSTTWRQYIVYAGAIATLAIFGAIALMLR